MPSSGSAADSFSAWHKPGAAVEVFEQMVYQLVSDVLFSDLRVQDTYLYAGISLGLIAGFWFFAAHRKLVECIVLWYLVVSFHVHATKDLFGGWRSAFLNACSILFILDIFQLWRLCHRVMIGCHREIIPKSMRLLILGHCLMTREMSDFMTTTRLRKRIRLDRVTLSEWFWNSTHYSQSPLKYYVQDLLV
jgi:hypothetical protein